MNDMTNENSVDGLIDRLQSGDMTQEEQAAFREQLARNPEQAKLLAADRMVTASVSRERALVDAMPVSTPSAALLAALKRINPAQRIMNYGFAIAGSFAILLTCLLVFTSQHGPLQRGAEATRAPSPTPQPTHAVADTVSLPHQLVQENPSGAPLEGAGATGSPLKGAGATPVPPHSQAKRVLVNEPSSDMGPSHGHGSAAATSNGSRASTSIQKDRDFDEGLGKPKVFSKDSIPIRIHTR